MSVKSFITFVLAGRTKLSPTEKNCGLVSFHLSSFQHFNWMKSWVFWSSTVGLKIPLIHKNDHNALFSSQLLYHNYCELVPDYTILGYSLARSIGIIYSRLTHTRHYFITTVSQHRTILLGYYSLTRTMDILLISSIVVIISQLL